MIRVLREVALTTWKQQLSLVRFEFAGEEQLRDMHHHRDKTVA
jgi:hypothetical protein